jgi:hypothetical protein
MTLKEAFTRAVEHAGYRHRKTLVDPRTYTVQKLYQSPQGNRYRLSEAVIAITKGDAAQQ